MRPDCALMNISHCFVFSNTTISTARVDYVCHQKITVQMSIDCDVSVWSCYPNSHYPYMIRPQLKKY